MAGVKMPHVDEYVELFRSGCTVSEIARLCGVTRQAISRSLHYRGVTKEEIAEVRKARKKARKEQIIALAKETKATTAVGAARVLSEKIGDPVHQTLAILYSERVTFFENEVDELLGTTVNYWLIKKRVSERGELKVRYLCDCLGCGREFVVCKPNITGGYSKSCLSCAMKRKWAEKKQKGGGN